MTSQRFLLASRAFVWTVSLAALAGSSGSPADPTVAAAGQLDQRVACIESALLSAINLANANGGGAITFDCRDTTIAMTHSLGVLEGGVVIDGEDRNITLEYAADFTGCSAGDNGIDGPEIADLEGQHNVLRNLTFKHFLESAQIKGSDNVIEGNKFLAHTCSDDALSSIEPGALNNVIRNNRFEGYLDKAFQMSYGSGTIEGNTFVDNAQTIRAPYDNSLGGVFVIRNNVMKTTASRSACTGVTIDGTYQIVFEGNTLQCLRGLRLGGGTQAIIRANLIEGNERNGILIGGDAVASLSGNVVLNNGMTPGSEPAGGVIVFENGQADLGGGSLVIGGQVVSSTGRNRFRTNNRGDVRNLRADYSLKAEANCWDHQTAPEIVNQDIEGDVDIDPTAASCWGNPTGIPHPSFGVEETHNMYAGQPGYSDAGAGPYSHYVDRTNVSCSDAGSGTAAQPRCTIPAVLPAGSVVEIHGGVYPGGAVDMVWTGTATQPIFVRGPDASAKPEVQARWRITGSYVIVENLRVTTPANLASWGISIGSADHVVIRHSEFAGNNADAGSGSVVAVEGPGAADTVIYGNNIHDNGNFAAGVENDMHGVSVSAGSTRTWIVDNVVHHNGGDGIHVSETSFAYIGRNEIHHDRENGVEVTVQALGENIVISQNTVHGYRESSSSGGEAIRVAGGESATDVWALNNKVYDATVGLLVSGTRRGWVIGNIVHDIEREAVSVQSSAPVNVFHNTIHSSRDGVIADSLSTIDFINNIVVSVTGLHAALPASGSTSRNLFFQPGGTVQAVIPDGCSSCIEADPLFANFPTDLHVLRGSPVKDAASNELSHANATYRGIFGDELDINVDFDARRRPEDGTECGRELHDLGAFEATEDPLAADLIVSSVVASLQSLATGGSFSVTDTVENGGVAAAILSSARFFLSTDSTRDLCDTPLTGTRTVESLAPGAASTGTLAVTVPASTPPATYFLIACADATKGVHESDEANNCRASAAAVEILAPDLVVSAVSNPPPTANLSTSFAISDTTVNLGVVPAAESTTRYYLSVDTVYSSGDERIGARTVPTLAAATESTATVDVAIPGDVSLGSYYLIACADDREVVTETNEAQNCAAASTTIQITAPDLVISAVSPPPATVAVGAGFTVTSTVENRGGGSSDATTTRHYLSTDALRNAGDRLLSGTVAAPGLAAGASFSGAVTVTTPVMTPGSYFVLACADDTSLGVESDESNNCTSSATQVTVAAPDLVVSALTNPPGIVNAGGSFAITETVENQGNATAGASTARYYLSLDQIGNSGDRALTPTRSVPSLGAGTSSTGTATAVVSSSTPLGTYYLLACADDAAVVAEGSESNNCTASTTTVQVMGTDLVVSAMTEPPSSASLGGSFAITETVHNQGNGSAGTSTTRYYLSVDTNYGGDKRLSATRSVPSLAGGAASAGSVTLVVPTMSLGPYYLIACADDLKTVAEHNESNNCRTSTSTIQVTAPDLRIVALTEPPQAAVLGATFVATDTVENAGNGVAGSSTTRYYFSSDSIYNSGDKRLSATRAVPSLPGGGSLSAPITLTVPSMAVGTYYLLACADDTNSVVEVNEANNCFAAATTVQVSAPDLVVTMVGEPPPTATVSGSFTVSAAVQNVGNGAAAGSATRFYVSADAVYNSGDKRLNGDLNAPVLAPGSLSSGTRTVGIPSSTIPGTYFLLACADDTKVVTEGNESNNCRASTTRITISQ